MTVPAQPPVVVAGSPRGEAPIPPVHGLTYGRPRGWNGYVCGSQLAVGAVSSGRACGLQGAHVRDAEAWGCP
ncbi:hypothetical protein GCM10009654_20460 [Streptomyces hebeiensis]|uniref:Uncharacterized protein n=1 Tax=Streptomyces hebeiensis TaxID=229486 RepID=A0ABN1UR51_9ACTN